MVFKASNVTNIDDFIDCAIFNVNYISLDIQTLLTKGKKFGVCISSVPLIKNGLVLCIKSENSKAINKALAMCNADILQFDEEVDIALLTTYKKHYTIWKYIDNKEDAKKYEKYVDSFVIPHSKLDELSDYKDISGYQIIVRATEKHHVERIQDVVSRNLVIDIDYNSDMSDFIKNKRLTIQKNELECRITVN